MNTINEPGYNLWCQYYILCLKENTVLVKQMVKEYDFESNPKAGTMLALRNSNTRIQDHLKQLVEQYPKHVNTFKHEQWYIDEFCKDLKP